MRKVNEFWCFEDKWVGRKSNPEFDSLKIAMGTIDIKMDDHFIESSLIAAKRFAELSNLRGNSQSRSKKDLRASFSKRFPRKVFSFAISIMTKERLDWK